MLTAENILGVLAGNKMRIRDLGVRRFGLFGSFVRGEEHEESDIDILVEFVEGKRSFDTYMDLKNFSSKIFSEERSTLSTAMP